jgi:uncharacterized membrane protein
MSKNDDQKTTHVKKNDSDSKLFAFLGVLLSIIIPLGYIIVMLSRKGDKYAVYYAKQGLAIFLAWVAAMVIGIILIGAPLIGNTLVLAVFVLWVVEIVNSLSGEEKETPLVGFITRKI